MVAWLNGCNVLLISHDVQLGSFGSLILFESESHFLIEYNLIME
ncbi:hypothetical protein LY16_01950 [Xenorhabdus doucetiae]|uniref:Uncharacterized protein n=1 Tax=Xenorhabdus doucetiae TaxID=351671 RepID=A0ABY3NRP8_9GAMM|nr:hypothetical protein LY16_01950 [Xenorhabdus doucetiae]